MSVPPTDLWYQAVLAIRLVWHHDLCYRGRYPHHSRFVGPVLANEEALGYKDSWKLLVTPDSH